MLDKNAFTPLYVQLCQNLREKILNGDYKDGEKIPSETRLMKAFNTTRGTVRNAISLLVKEGLVQQIQGKGTFVRLKELKYSIFNFGGFTDYLDNQNKTAVSRILEQNYTEINNEPYYKLVRARGVENDGATTFLTIDTSLLPLKLFPNIDNYNFENLSLYSVLRTEYKTFPKYTDITLSPLSADAHMKEVLHLNPKEEMLLKAKGSIFDINHTEIEKVEVIYSTKIEFNIMTNIADESN